MPFFSKQKQIDNSRFPLIFAFALIYSSDEAETLTTWSR
nr:MAG TPA: hypothetical protein [Caudoviricetes sp.]